MDSIAKASEETGIPYRTVLKNIENMEKDLGSPVVVTKRGGKGGGGGSELTDKGKEILFKFIKINRVLKKQSELNELKGTVTEINEENKIMKVVLDKKEINLPTGKNFSVGDDVLVTISPSNIFIILEPQESSVRNTLEGTISGMKLKDDTIRLTVKADQNNIVVDITEFSSKKLDLNLGKKVFIGFKAASADIIKID